MTILLRLALACGLALTVSAAVITNGSFETPDSQSSPSLAVGSTYLTGWTVIDAEVAQVWNTTFAQIPAFDGQYHVDLAGYHDSVPYGGVSQTIATTPGATYEVVFHIAALNGTTAVRVTAANLVDVASVVSPGGTQVWDTVTRQFTATGATTNLMFEGVTASGGNYIGLDDISVTALSAVPEPSTAMLVFSAIWLLAARRCRK